MKFLRYIQHSLSGKEAHRLELEAMKDPFLAESLEGYETVKGNHTENLKFLRSRLIKRKYTPAKRANWNIAPWYITATILLCVGIGGYFMVQKTPNKAKSNIPQEMSDSVQTDTIQTDTILKINKL